MDEQERSPKELNQSKTQRTIARARTLSVLRALDSDRKGELVQFLSAAQLIKRDKPIINLSQAALWRAALWEANLESAYLWGANLEGANLEGANLGGAIGLNPTEIKSACNWEEAKFSEEFKQKLAQEPDQKVDCSYWDAPVEV